MESNKRGELNLTALKERANLLSSALRRTNEEVTTRLQAALVASENSRGGEEAWAREVANANEELALLETQVSNTVKLLRPATMRFVAYPASGKEERDAVELPLMLSTRQLLEREQEEAAAIEDHKQRRAGRSVSDVFLQAQARVDHYNSLCDAAEDALEEAEKRSAAKKRAAAAQDEKRDKNQGNKQTPNSFLQGPLASSSEMQVPEDEKSREHDKLRAIMRRQYL